MNLLAQLLLVVFYGVYFVSVFVRTPIVNIVGLGGIACTLACWLGSWGFGQAIRRRGEELPPLILEIWKGRRVLWLVAAAVVVSILKDVLTA